MKALTQAGSVTGNGGPQETAVNDELMKLMAVIPSQGSNLDTGEKSILANALWTRKGVSVKQSYADAMLKMFQVTSRPSKPGCMRSLCMCVCGWVPGGFVWVFVCGFCCVFGKGYIRFVLSGCAVFVPGL